MTTRSREAQALIAAVAARYRSAGPFAERFARGKLSRDPIYLDLLERGEFPDGAHVLDLGCGRALLLCLLAESSPGRGLRLHGIEGSFEQVRLAQLALGSDGVVEQAELERAALPPSDRIALIDVVHYLEPGAQDVLLERIAAALRPGGILLLRVCDDAQRARAALTRALDRFGSLVRGQRLSRLHGRSAAAWTALLERLGLRTSVEPASRGTPFANVLIRAHKPR